MWDQWPRFSSEVFVLVQASSPPAAAAPAPPAPAQASRLLTIAQRTRPLILIKAGRSETAVVRQQIFLKTSVRPGAMATVEGQAAIAAAATPCAWVIEAYLQREVCFSSMTGLSSCTDAVSLPLAAGETGQTDLASPIACDVQAGPVALAERRVVASLQSLSAGLFEDDYRIKIRPMLAASGVTIRETPQAVPSRASGSGTR
jgi:hypothetical protein